MHVPNEKNLIIETIKKNCNKDIIIKNAATSHIKSTSVYNCNKYHNAIGSFFLNISNIEEVKEQILNPLINKDVDFSFNKTESYYSILTKNKFNSIKNNIYGEMTDLANKLNAETYYFSKKELNIIYHKNVHYSNSDFRMVDNKQLSKYLDIVGLIKSIEYFREKKIYNMSNQLIDFSKLLIEDALSEHGCSDCLEVQASIILTYNKHVSETDLTLTSIFPKMPYAKNMLKIKNLITHYNKLITTIKNLD